MTLAFEYLEIRPCIKLDDGFISFTSIDEFHRECHLFTERNSTYSTCWTIYGRYADEEGQLLAMAIGDFSTKEAAFSVMNAILAPMATARDLIRARDSQLDASRAADALEDFIAQSSDRERL